MGRGFGDGKGEDGDFVVVQEDYIHAFQQFLINHHLEALEAILLAEDDTLHYPLQVDFAELLEASPPLANLIYTQPARFLPLFDNAARLAQSVVLEAHKHIENMSVKGNVHVRLDVNGSAMDCPETHPSIGRVRVKDMGKLITLQGTVIRSGAIKMLEGEREYECTKCKHRFKVFPELETGNTVRQPMSCPSQRVNRCQGTNFKYIEDSKMCHDYQEIKIQENMQSLGVGSVPRSIPVVLKDDLVDFVKAGDDIIVTGLLFAKWRPVSKDVRCDLDLVLLANYIRRTNELKLAVDISEEAIKQFEGFWMHFKDNPLKGRNIILQGICPQVYGLFTVKLADASGTKVRGESHFLLVGDPGTGKSQFLKFASKLSHRSVITTGLGSTSAGLTVTAVKDGGEWMLEAGALVLADGGLCCIDEFDSIREPDRATIHEAMEQQTISVAKAGLVTTLNTRTTVFGVTNPKGQYDPYRSLSVNTSLSSPLLSRFDIILVLLDTKKPDWDKIVSSHILSEHEQKEKVSANDDLRGLWTLLMLRRYIHFVKGNFRPVLTKQAERVISSYYQLQRRSATQNAARTTIRMLESLIRLAQAHARLMFRDEVTRLDAISAIICVESSMTTSAILDNVGNVLHSSFTENPDEEYAKQEKLILEKLNLVDNTFDNQNGSDGIAKNVEASNHQRVNNNQPVNGTNSCNGKSNLRPCSYGDAHTNLGKSHRETRVD
ncbi:probable DNA helicase MCM9 isoform X2 [Cryptomeria japonica]|uniref:probable DNA helicase MCM9 isoform X2 n=1 Tax=Cryptomeria japonica TaxID=3369 RepID=UPI0027D9D3E7|nr:probable DNA helicase MCM9 isoform X2 [Cryptomeria japonica]